MVKISYQSLMMKDKVLAGEWSKPLAHGIASLCFLGLGV